MQSKSYKNSSEEKTIFGMHSSIISKIPTSREPANYSIQKQLPSSMSFSKTDMHRASALFFVN